MAFILNDITVGAMAGLASLTLHETVSGKNRVVHIIVPMVSDRRQTAVARRKQARTLAKAALQDAAKAL